MAASFIPSQLTIRIAVMFRFKPRRELIGRLCSCPGNQTSPPITTARFVPPKLAAVMRLRFSKMS
jgi:hypothetical protein